MIKIDLKRLKNRKDRKKNEFSSILVQSNSQNLKHRFIKAFLMFIREIRIE